MSGSAETGSGTPVPATVEQRLRGLEMQVEALTDAVDALARGLGEAPDAEPLGGHAAEAGRRARELLLLAKSASPERP